MTTLVADHPFAYEMERLMRLFYPGASVAAQPPDAAPDSGDTVITRAECVQGSWHLSAGVGGQWRTETLAAPATDKDAELALGRLLYRLLQAQTGRSLSWGILTGVRPMRVCRAALARAGGDEQQARRDLQQRTLISAEKLDLLMEIAAVQRDVLSRVHADGVSLYISIPFCPSRCLYCSFVSHDIAGTAKLVPEYLQLLCREIRKTGRLVAQRGLHLQSVYIGGGTPTTLEAHQLEQLMQTVAASFDLSRVLEYTVEAGRPDTLTAEKMQTLRAMGADRVSINPQTMDDAILQAIGRNHTAEQVVQGMALARAAGFTNINMDLIAGLPGETGTAFARSLEQVLALSPASITVHTLTVKRSSRLCGDASLPAADGVSVLLQNARELLAARGYRPYYLYRQKDSRHAGGGLEDLENTGYACSGREGVYNVFSMEEVQTVLAVGAGAVTKLYRPGQPLQRVFNFKFPYEYIRRFDEILARKAQTGHWIGGAT